MPDFPPDSAPVPVPASVPSAAPADKDPPARTRLLLAALRLFAQQGYAKTSIRAIAQAAQVNVAAISYYFGDKAALYAALFTEPAGNMQDLMPQVTQPGLDLREALRRYYHGTLAPLQDGELARLLVQLHIREMLDRTDQWERELERDVRQPHQAMLDLLCRHMGVAQPDADMHRLTLTVTGLAFQLWALQEAIDAVQPQLLATPQAVDAWAGRMTEYALAMIETEQRLRQSPAPDRRDAAPATPAPTPLAKPSRPST
ncbi:CerR family C-terminal domain-containing protein [Paracidovorax wautersii]|uniref:AcrR family transcriptional regulator n=1 Tax=Paracidovorax wautersii TaxID=1177982 RepID=A0ABU1I851_9BURK|nr:CerR family C-terminal domain-containing protein [Paracidovorax wautersii]MDR6213408.1 AcrR family transcriptional regulator [Paracidovorax wautersii]